MPVCWKEEHRTKCFSDEFLARIDQKKADEIRGQITDSLAKIHEAIDEIIDFLGTLERNRLKFARIDSEERYDEDFLRVTHIMRNHRRRIAEYERRLAQLDAFFPPH
jgi:hypothetical protein